MVRNPLLRPSQAQNEVVNLSVHHGHAHITFGRTRLRKSAAVNEVNPQAKGRRIPTRNAGWLSWNGAKDGCCRSVVSMAESWQNAVSCKPQPSQSYHSKSQEYCYIICSLNSLKGGYIGDYLGDCYRFIKGDTRSLDYRSHNLFSRP